MLSQYYLILNLTQKVYLVINYYRTKNKVVFLD